MKNRRLSNFMKAILALADGRVFEGESFGAEGEALGEVVFNTSMTGYQEILTDPSYEGQLVAMTYPEIGNVGVNPEDVESRQPFMGIDTSFGIAFAKAQLGGGMRLPQGGKVFISVRDEDKPSVAPVAKKLYHAGFEIVATRGTAAYFEARGIPSEVVNKVQEGSPHIGDQVKNGEVAMVINTPTDAHSQADSYSIRRFALDYQVPYFTTIAGAEAAAEGIEYLKEREFDVKALQDYEAPLLP